MDYFEEIKKAMDKESIIQNKIQEVFLANDVFLRTIFGLLLDKKIFTIEEFKEFEKQLKPLIEKQVEKQREEFKKEVGI